MHEIAIWTRQDVAERHRRLTLASPGRAQATRRLLPLAPPNVRRHRAGTKEALAGRRAAAARRPRLAVVPLT